MNFSLDGKQRHYRVFTAYRLQAQGLWVPAFAGTTLRHYAFAATRWLAMTRWQRLCPSPKQRPMIPQDHARGVVAGGAGDAAAGMRAASGMVEAF